MSHKNMTYMTKTFPRLSKGALLLVLLLFPITLSARHLSGRVVDAQGNDLQGATVELLSAADSSVIRATQTRERTLWGYKYWTYDIDVDNNTTYILRFSMLGFKTQWKRVEVKMADRVNEQWVDEVKLEEDSKVLDEVVVKATKIKMVMRGDTVVYDASAFNLSEGSMLDALIRQLPGATLEDGVIKVNGKTVSTLLIDGRDFFNGDAKKALENLPAYTVENIKAYDKAGRESRFMQRDMGDKDFVLDVTLKKQYKHGWMSNVDVAAGTHDRYSGRLFTMAYGKKSRLTVTANLNNVNNERVPGQDDATGDMPDTGNGLTARKEVNAEYTLQGKDEDNYFSTSNTYAFTDNDSRTRVNAQTFLTGGDYYNLSTSLARTKNTTWSSNNSFSWTPRRQMVWGTFNVSHTSNDGLGASRSGRFSQKPTGMQTLDSIFMPDAARTMTDMLINRVRNDNHYSGSSTSLAAFVSHDIKLSRKGDFWEGDRVGWQATVSYAKADNDRYALNRIEYLRGGNNDYRDQYTATRNHNYQYNLSANYTHFLLDDSAGLRNLFVRPDYTFTQSYNSSDYGLYRLDRLADYDSTSNSIGVLPSTREALLGVQDAANSYRTHFWRRNHAMTLTLNYDDGDGTQRPRYAAEARVVVQNRDERLDYFRARPYNSKRNKWIAQPSVYAVYNFNDSTGSRSVRFSYSESVTLPDLTSMLTIRDDANPLAVTLGNPDLKSAQAHSFYLSATRMHVASQQLSYASLGYILQRNAIATAMLYDKQTGITTTQQRNVNGNWSMDGYVRWQRPVDKKQHLTLGVALYTTYNNSVDLTSVKTGDDDGTAAERSDVHNWTANLSTSLTYQLGEKLRLQLSPRVNYQRATSGRQDFATVSAWQYDFALEGNVQLPWGFEFSTDLTSYNRRGYNDADMNTSNLVWNARLTKLLLKKKLTLALDAFDILGDINSTTFTLNTQGRTEAWHNSLPRYVMLHASYKFTLGMKSS